MAERKPLFSGAEGYSEEMAQTDTATFGGLTLSGALAMGTNKITGLGDPTTDQDAATKSYVDATIEGLSPKASVVVRAQGDVTLSGPGATVDGITMAVDDRFLADSQTTTTEDGIYLWKGAAAAAVRTDDAQVAADFSGVHVFVEEGTDADTGYLCSNDSGADIVGTDDLVFVKFTSLGQITTGTGLTKSGNTIDAIGGDGIIANANDLAVDLAATPGLEFNGAQLQVKLDGTTLLRQAGGMSVKGLPSLFEINAVAVGANVTSANLDTLTGGGDASALHTHTGSDEASRVENTLTTATDTTADGDPVYTNGNDTVGKARADTDAKAHVIGVIRTGSGTAGATPDVVSAGPCAGVLTAATAGDGYYLGTTGGLSLFGALAAGDRVYLMGYAENASDLWVQMQDLGKKAA